MKRILVVDGDTGVRARIAKHARMEGYDVTEAGDGETALSLSRQQNAFDLMVLAVNLPGMDGFTVLKAVRTFSAIPHRPRTGSRYCRFAYPPDAPHTGGQVRSAGSCRCRFQKSSPVWWGR